MPSALAQVLPSQRLRKRSPHKRRGKNKVMLLGLKTLDGRSPAVKAFAHYRRQLHEQLGEDLSAAEEHLVEMYVRGRVILDHLDAQLFAFKSLLLGKGKGARVMPLALERFHFAKILSSQLSTLGLKRATRIRSLPDDLLKAKPVGEDDT